MNDSRKQHEMCELMLASLNGKLTQAQEKTLSDLLKNDEEARQYYSKLLLIVSSMHCPGQADVQMEIAPITENDSVLREVLEEQWANQSVTEIAKTEANTPSITYHRKHIAGKPLFRVAGAIAALVIFAFMLNNLSRLISQRSYDNSSPSHIVAKLINDADASWEVDGQQKKINQEMTAGVYKLTSGLAHMKFLDGANVIIEAPARFDLESDSRLFLFSGKLTANVPHGSEGFKVATPSADYVDIGTEFGIKVDDDGNSQMHVFEGAVLLFPGNRANANRKSIRVNVGQSRGVNKATGKIIKSKINRYSFVRKMTNGYEIAVRKTSPQAYWSFDTPGQKNIINKIGDETYVGQLEAKSQIVRYNQSASAIKFSSAKDRVDFGDVLDPGKDSYSVAIWFKVNKLDSKFDQILATKRSVEGQGYPGWTIFVNRNSMFIRTGDGDDLRSHVWIKNLNCLTTGWHQVTMVIDREDNILRGYLDGSDYGWATHNNDGVSPEHDSRIAYNTYRDGTSIENDYSLCMNAYINDAGEKRTFQGLIYDMGIWKRALSSVEIEKLYRNCPLIK